MRTLIAIARADFRERTRQKKYLTTLIALAILASILIPSPSAGYAIVAYNDARGQLTSTYVGLIVALLTNCVLVAVGFFLVSSVIRRDYATGVGEIIAATPLTKRSYLLGKLLGNSLYLLSFVPIMIVLASVLQIFRGEGPFDLWAIVYPFLLLPIPTVAIVSAVGLLTEVLRLDDLGGGCFWYLLSNIIIFVGIFTVAFLDYTGTVLFSREIMSVLMGITHSFGRQPGADITPGSVGILANIDPNAPPFVWPGLRFGVDLFLERYLWLPVAIGLTVAVAPLFDRFRSSYRRFHGRATARQVTRPTREDADLPRYSTLPALAAAPQVPGLLRTVRADLRLLLRQHFWFVPLCALNALVTPINSAMAARFALLLPIPLLADLGTHENVHGTEELVFSTPGARTQRLLRKGLAGLVIVVLAGGVATLLRLPALGVSLATGLLLTLAWSLCANFLSGSPRLFTASMLFFWYVACLNEVPPLFDYGGVHLNAPAWGATLSHLALSGVLLALAYFTK